MSWVVVGSPAVHRQLLEHPPFAKEGALQYVDFALADSPDINAQWYLLDYSICDQWLDKRSLAWMDKPFVLLAQSYDSAHYRKAAEIGAIDLVMASDIDRLQFLAQRYNQEKPAPAVMEVLPEIEVPTTPTVSKATPKDPNALIHVIDNALKNNLFELHFQPLLAVKGRGTNNYEVFVRIRHEGELIYPDSFIPVAEQYGLMPIIDRWVVKEALCRYRREVTAGGEKEFRFFINLSRYSLTDKVMLREIIRLIAASRLPAASIVIDVDKNTVLSRLQMAKALNKNIKKLQLQFSINHYEHKDINLDYSQHIELDFIKLHGELTFNLESDDHKQELVKSIIDKAKQLNLKTIACKVENVRTVMFLYRMGVDLIQGYAVAEPLPELDHSVFASWYQ